MRPTHIYWFAYYNPASPSTRYRGKYVLESLKSEHGISYDFVFPDYDLNNLLRFARVYLSALLFRKEESLIVFQKIYSKGFYAKALLLLLFFRGKHTLYDTDDAEHLRFPPEIMHRFMRGCSICTVGSAALLKYVQHYNSHVHLLTSPIINHDYSKQERNKVFTIGWVGGYNSNKESSKEFGHKRSIENILLPAIKNLKFNVRFVLLGVTDSRDREALFHYFEESQQVTLETPLNIDWQNENFVYRYITLFDVGVSPMVDHEFNRAKSAFKIKQYSSCGVPVLASSIGENLRFVDNGYNGFLCDTSMEYEDKLTVIRNMTDPHYRQMCVAAKETTARFSMKNHCNTLLQQLS